MNLFKWLFKSKTPEKKLYPIYEHVIIGKCHWSSTPDGSYKLLIQDKDIFMPNGYIDKDCNIIEMRIVGWSETDPELERIERGFTIDTADQHGEGNA